MLKNINVWLAYVSYPVTTGVYFERALRKHFNVVTIGPSITKSLIEDWNLESMKLPIIDHNIPTGGTPDIKAIFDNTPNNLKPDLFLWVESVFGYFPSNIDKLGIPTAAYFIDSHLNNIDYQLEWAKFFDYVFLAQKEYIPRFTERGCKKVFWLPLGCDPDIHKSYNGNKIYDVGFVGGTAANPRRVDLMNRIKEEHNFYYERCFWDDMAKVLDSSKIVFNNAVNNDLNMRVFETLSIGSFLLTDATYSNGQEEFFNHSEELGLYEDESINHTIKYYLENAELRELIAKRGHQLAINAHTYEHRLLELIDVTLGNKPFTPTGIEWRERSLQNVTVSLKDINYLRRSFVIPVLDYAPASKYNIKTLLKDLEKIEGKLLIVFNDETVANQIKDHPRINNYAVMKKNVGVARAWNLGLNMSDTPITLILNSDIHIQNDVVEKISSLIEWRKDAAMVGPQGSFFSFNDKADFMYFDKGKFSETTAVDAVSGFLFGVNSQKFDKHGLKFENRFTPCYYEEWDIGLQIKNAGLKSYIVPSVSYDHIWGGSIGSYKKIKYLDKEETARGILNRNSEIFTNKWREIHKELISKDSKKHKDLFVSGYADFVNSFSEKLIEKQEYTKAAELLEELIKFYPDLYLTNLKLSLTYSYLGNIEKALKYIEIAILNNPGDEIAKDIKTRLSEIKSKYGL